MRPVPFILAALVRDEERADVADTASVSRHVPEEVEDAHGYAYIGPPVPVRGAVSRRLWHGNTAEILARPDALRV